MLYVWPVVDLSLEDVRRGRPPARAADRGPRPRAGGGQRQPRIAADPSRSKRSCASGTNRAAASWCASPSRPTEAMQPLDDYTRKLVQMRRRGLVYPYELVPALARRRRVVRRARPRRRPARSCRSNDRPAATRPASSSASSPRRPTGYPEGVTRGGRARRSDQGDGLDHRGRVPAAARGDRPRRRARRADRVVRPVGGRQDRHGLRQREPRLGGPGAAAARRAHPARRRGQRRGRRASTSAPSRTGTPRRRCSCTPGASSS